MTTTIKCFVSLTNGSAVVSLTAGNAGNAGLNLSAPNVIEDMLLIVQDPVNALRIIKGSLSTTSFELQEAWNGTTVTNAQARISTSGAAISGLTQAIRDLITKYAAVPYGDNGLTLADSMMRLVGSADSSKIVKFEVDGLTTGTTRTVTVPDADVTIPTQAQMDSKFDKSGGAISGNVSVAGVMSVGSAGTGTTPSDINLDGSSAANYGPMMRFKRNGVTVGYLGTGSAVLGGSSDDLVLYRTTGGRSVTISSTGLAVTGVLSATGVVNLGGQINNSATGTFEIINRNGTTIDFYTNSASVFAGRFDAIGNLLVGATSGSNHCLWKNAADGTLMLDVAKTSGVPTARFYTCSAAVDPNAAGANLLVWRNASTLRSINAAGTINQSGADYAEYERNNGTKFAKGQVVGFREDGTLTDVYADAIRFGVKSTNPGLVGGDAWGTDKQVGLRPEEPQFKEPEYKGPQDPGAAPIEPVQQSLPEDASDEDKAKVSEDFATAHAAWVTASADYEKLAYEYRAAQQDHEVHVEVAKNLFDTATYPEYQRALAAFEARLEAERQTVDRIAYCGKVPVAVYDATPGGYIIADKDHDGKIIGKFVADPDFAQYKKAVGRVNRIMDAEASAHLVEAINGTNPALFVGMAEIAVIIH